MRKYLTERHKKNISQSLKGRIYKKKHGENSKNSPEYRTWASIKSRCYNPKVISYKDYGGRGIKVCFEWINSYENFLKDMGRRPIGKYSIERIDNNKGYSKENCKWILLIDQLRNRRNSIIFNDETSDKASKRLGGSRYLVRSRLFRGWLIKDAFTIPLVIR